MEDYDERCLICKKFINSPCLNKFNKIIEIDNEISHLCYLCCNKCVKNIESDKPFQYFLENLINENYNEFLKNGINSINIKNYYYNLQKISKQKYNDFIFEVLDEIYDEIFDESSYILK